MMMTIMTMMMMIMMMKMIIAVTQSILKLGPPNFAWNQVQIISNSDDDYDDYDDDNDDHYSCNSVNF